MNVLRIVEKYLKDNKCIGLMNKELDCVCEIDNLYPCRMTAINECIAVTKEDTN